MKLADAAVVVTGGASGAVRVLGKDKTPGSLDEFARLAESIVKNGYLNGETIRLDGANRLVPR